MTVLAALQAALGVEEQVVYGYGALGARLSGAEEKYAGTCLVVHMQRRDALRQLVVDAGGQPVAAAPAYQLPFRLDGPSAARRLAVRLEQASAGAAWDLIANSTPATAPRASGVAWLGDAGIRLEHWGAELALPGQPD